jgi:hypothetical protein
MCRKIILAFGTLLYRQMDRFSLWLFYRGCQKNVPIAERFFISPFYSPKGDILTPKKSDHPSSGQRPEKR